MSALSSQQSNRRVSTDRYDSNHARAIAAPSRLVLDKSALSSTSKIITKDVHVESATGGHMYGEIGQLSPKGSRSGSALGPHGRRPLDSVQKYFQRFLMAGHHKLGNLKVSTSSARWHSTVRRSIHYTCPEKQPIIVRVLVAFGGVVIRITSGTSVTFQFCRCTMQWQRNLKLAGV